MPYVCVFSSPNTYNRMMDFNGFSPAEFLRPFGEVGNLNNYSIKTVEKNPFFKLNNFKINFIDSQAMWDQAKKTENLPTKIIHENKPRIKPNMNPPTTKEEINN